MYYSININQLAIATHNETYNTNIDLIDGVILEYLQKQSISTFAKRNYIIHQGEIYYMICYDNIITQLPLLNITSKEVIGRRLKKMAEYGIIQKYIDRKSMNKTYFTTTELFETFFTQLPTQKSLAPDSKVVNLPTQKSDHIIDNNINDNNINDTKDKDASAFSLSQSNCKENLDSSTCKKTLQVQKQKNEELKTKQEVQEFVKNFKAKEIVVDGILQTTPIFLQNEIDLITEYILRRKEAYKAKVKNTQKALTGVLNDILQVMKEISLETIFEQQEGIYVHCGTAGDKSKPFQTIKLEYFKHLKQRPTFNNQNANTLRQELNSHKQQINSTQIDNYF